MATLLDYALTNVADVKESLGIDAGDSSKNNLIIRKINMATEIIEGYTGRRFKLTTYTNEEYDSPGIDQLVLRQRPVTALSGIDLRQTSQNEDDWSTVDSDFYFLDSVAGVVDGIFTYTGHYNRVRVTYTAGYDTIPSDIQEAAVALASFLVENSSSGTNVKRKTEGQRSIEYFDSQQNGGSVVEQLGLDEILNRYTNYPLRSA